MSKIVRYLDSGIHENGPRIPVVHCSCGDDVNCYGFTNPCFGCEAEYNFAGQLLAPRDQWGYDVAELEDY